MNTTAKQVLHRLSAHTAPAIMSAPETIITVFIILAPLKLPKEENTGNYIAAIAVQRTIHPPDSELTEPVTVQFFSIVSHSTIITVIRQAAIVTAFCFPIAELPTAR